MFCCIQCDKCVELVIPNILNLYTSLATKASPYFLNTQSQQSYIPNKLNYCNGIHIAAAIVQQVVCWLLRRRAAIHKPKRNIRNISSANSCQQISDFAVVQQVVCWLARRKARVRIPGHEPKRNMKKFKFLRRFPLSRFLVKTLRANKPANEKVSQKFVVRS